MIGVPYAHAAVDSDGYYVRCPECGQTFHETSASEHQIGKAAAKKYAIHYTDIHEEAEETQADRLIRRDNIRDKIKADRQKDPS